MSRVHPKWTDPAYWQAIADRAATLESEQRKEAKRAARQRRIREDVERFWASTRNGRTG